MSLSERIKAIRIAKKISQTEIANALNTEKSNYHRLENRGEKLTVEQVEAIAGALGVSVVELLTDEPQTVQDDVRVKELEKRANQLEETIALYKDNLLLKEREFERVREYFTKAFYDEIAKMSFEKGYSKLKMFSKVSGKLIVSGSKNELMKQFKEPLKNEPIYLFTYQIQAIIAKSQDLDLWQTREEFVIIEKFKQKAVNLFFYNWIGSDDQSKVEMIFESGVITDSILLSAYEKAKHYQYEGIEAGYDVNEDLELVISE